MILSTSSGLDEGYMFSDAEAGAQFAISLQALITLLRGLNLRVGDGAQGIPDPDPVNQS